MEEIICQNCGKDATIPQKVYQIHNGHQVWCEDCVEKYAPYTCEKCNTKCASDSVAIVRDKHWYRVKPWCAECANSYAFYCHGCRLYVQYKYERPHRLFGTATYCEYCYDEMSDDAMRDEQYYEDYDDDDYDDDE